MSTLILILDYPTNMSFQVRKDLPEFNGECSIRQEILLRQMKRQKIDSPCHAYEDYVIEDVVVMKECEIWTLGS